MNSMRVPKSQTRRGSLPNRFSELLSFRLPAFGARFDPEHELAS